MRNHLNWLFLLLLGIAMIGCQDDITVNDPISNSGLNKSSSAAKYVEENLTTDLVVTGSGIVAAGTGTENIGGGVINFSVPAAATVKKVFLYWEGRYDVTSGTPDDDCVVNSNNVVGELIGKAALDNARPAYTHRADITNLGLVVPGNNVLTVTGFTNTGGYYINRPNGVGVIVVYSEPGKESDIEIRDGCDFSYILEGTFANYTNKQTFTFPAESVERQATLHMFIGDLLDDEKTGNMRPHFLRYKVGTGAEQTLFNPFSQNGGPEWETYALNLTIPAGVTQVDVEVQSGPGKAGDRPEPASLTWVAATLTVPKANLLAEVGDRIWKDLNRNGIQDPGEEGFPGVTVALYTCDPNAPDGGWLNIFMDTDANGLYFFKNLQPGTYKIRMNIPDEWKLSPKDQGTNDKVDSDFLTDALGTFTECFTLDPGESDSTWDGGLYPNLGQIGDRVWRDDKDKDCNGIQDPTEVGVEGVTVQLYDCATPTPNFIKETTTNASGEYLFTELPAGCYKIKFVLPAGFEFSAMDQGSNDSTDSDANPANGFTASVNLGAGESNRTVDAGLCPKLGEIGDKVWKDNKDQNCNGIQDPTEVGVEGVTVELYDCATPTPNKLKETKTNASGEYLFTELPAGCYKVKFILPAGYNFTAMDQGTNDAVDSDANPANGFTADINLGAGESNRTVDAGLCPKLGQIGDKVWRDDKDKDCNGIQDPTELGVEGVTVELYDCATPTPNKLKETKTNASGEYLFTDLPEGCYKVKFVLPAGFEFTAMDQGTDDAKDSDVNPANGFTASVNLGPGEINKTVDAGLCPKYSKIGDRVWKDMDCDGVQDAGETGVSGVMVKLYDCNGLELATTFTDANGNYLFDKLLAGCYKIKVFLPLGYKFAPQNNGDNTKDSDVNVFTGISDDINLGTAQTDLSWDAGLCPEGPCAPCKGGVSEITIMQLKPGPVTFPNLGSDEILTANPPYYNIKSNDGSGMSSFDVYLNGAMNTNIHTSCSQPVDPGLVYGDFVITYSRSKDGGPICPPDCKFEQVEFKFNGDKIEWKLKNTGQGDLVLKEVYISWPQATNGQLEKIRLDGDAYVQLSNSPLTVGEDDWTASNLKPRWIKPGDTKTLEFNFKNNVSTDGTKYTITVTFYGTDCVLEYTPETGGGTECTAKIAATLLQYTGPDLGVVTVKFQGKDGGVATYTNVNLTNGTILQTGDWTVSALPGNFGTEFYIYINGTLAETHHTSCSTPYVVNKPAPLNSPKGAPSPNWFVLNFRDADDTGMPYKMNRRQ